MDSCAADKSANSSTLQSTCAFCLDRADVSLDGAAWLDAIRVFAGVFVRVPLGVRVPIGVRVPLGARAPIGVGVSKDKSASRVSTAPTCVASSIKDKGRWWATPADGSDNTLFDEIFGEGVWTVPGWTCGGSCKFSSDRSAWACDSAAFEDAGSKWDESLFFARLASSARFSASSRRLTAWALPEKKWMLHHRAYPFWDTTTELMAQPL